MARMGAAAAAAQPLAPPGADAAAQARYRAGSEEVRPIRSARDAASLDGAAAGRRALAALERLGDTDTLAQGRSELRSIARLCPPQAVAGLLEALFAALRRPSAQEAGPAARAAAVGAFAALARTKGRALAAHVPRLVAHLLRHFKGTVRGSTRSGSAEQRDPVSDACADAFAALAASGAAGSSAGELEALWRPLIEAMHDSDPAIQATACHCLTAMIGATVSDSARRSSATAAFPKLLRHVERPVFGARREALDALGALLALGAEAQAHAGTLLRLAEQALADPKDFAARRSGAQLIVDMASSLSHDLLRYASQARSALEGARYDRVASVRSAVAEATRAVERLVGVDGGDDGDDSRGGLSSRGRRARSALQMKPNDAFFHKRDVPLVVSALPPEREISAGSGFGSGHTPWQRVLAHLEQGNLNAAFHEALNPQRGSDSALVRLLGRVDPCLHKLTPETGGAVVKRLGSMVLDDTHAELAILWVAQVGVVELALQDDDRMELLTALDTFGRKYRGPGGQQARDEHLRLAHAWTQK